MFINKNTLFSLILATGILPFSTLHAADEQAVKQLEGMAGQSVITVPAPVTAREIASGAKAASIDRVYSGKIRRTISKNIPSTVMIQGFDWASHKVKPWWSVVGGKAGELSSAGFDTIWFPPSGQAASDEGYIPVQLYNQNSQYGSIQQLQSAINAFHAKNMLVLADIVINHRVGSKDWGDFTNPQWGPDAVCSDDEWGGARGHRDTGWGFQAARDIDHTQPYVRESIKDWLRWLKNDVGYDGWRYDFAKGFSPSYVELYNDASAPVFSVGEIWDNLDINNPNPHRQGLCNWIDGLHGKATVFDFTTKGLLQHAVGSREYWRLRDNAGKPVGLIGWWPEQAVTFLDNHDTGPSTGGGQSHWPFPANNLMQGYAYILTHPGIPCVYWPHFFDWGQDIRTQITALIKFRKAKGITSAASVNILAADNSKYAAQINSNVVMKIGPGDYNPGSGWTLAISGKDYAVWSR